MRFEIVSVKSRVPLGEYDERAPCVRLEQGRARTKRPLDLAPGEQAIVDYPLDGAPSRTLECAVRRLDERPDATIVVGVDPGIPGAEVGVVRLLAQPSPMERTGERDGLSRGPAVVATPSKPAKRLRAAKP